MKDEEKMMCQLVFDKGNLLEVLESECDGVNISCYVVELNGSKYTLTSHDGEWIYFNHIIESWR